MLSFSELRKLCGIQNFRSFMIAAATNDKCLQEIFYKCDFSLGCFISAVKNDSTIYPEEERIIIETIKTEEPTDLHLFLILANSDVPLTRELRKKGLDMNLLKNELTRELGPKKKKIYQGDYLSNPLLKIYDSQKN